LDQCFVPIAAGGGIHSLEDADTLLKSGGDKIVINTILQKDPCLVKNLVSIYGSQCVIGSIDFKKVNGQFKAFAENGCEEIPVSLEDYLKKVQDLGVGEIYLNSIDKDGTGQGFVMEVLDLVDQARNPVILAGGAGNSKHFLEAILHKNVSAVATANLFNFIGNGLPTARSELKKQNILLAEWNIAEEKKLYNYFC
jgi:imidazole glycerol-phosphate synthase subunit HisF